ncbi:MAG TPA: MaoC family dehydratase [Alphaproteobacteria bacterium]|nr:MaoC family dehydratase [Alphaproteobacteria bacterium]
MAERYYEDFAVGERMETGGATLTEGHMIDFALAYDPQPFHIDAEAAKRSMFGGLVASGLLTLAISARLFLQSGALGNANLGGPGFEEVRFLRPVRPGDTLRVVVEVSAMRPSQSKPDRGVVSLLYRTYNQRGEEVLSFICLQIFRRRSAQALPPSSDQAASG